MAVADILVEIEWMLSGLMKILYTQKKSKSAILPQATQLVNNDYQLSFKKKLKKKSLNPIFLFVRWSKTTEAIHCLVRRNFD